MFPPGGFVNVYVNLTGSGQIGAFDININYNLTQGPNVLQVVSGTLAGGLFDEKNPQTSCSVLAPHKDLFVPGFIRFAATYVGGCTHDLTGIIFKLVFQVNSVGAGSIDILQSSSGGRTGTTLVGPASQSIPYVTYSAYFRNKAGTPPVPAFTYSPPKPVTGDYVTFNATTSYDPENPTGPNHGIQPEPVVYDQDGDGIYNAATDRTIFGPVPADGTSLGTGQTCSKGVCKPAHNTDPNLLFVDTNGNGHWDPSEPVIYDTDNSLTYTFGDVPISGSQPALGTHLSLDPKIQYVDLHTNSIWDNGYVWDFGDGTQIVPGNVTVHQFIASAAVLATGTFPVKLVVYDLDDSLPMRLLQQVKVSIAIIHDVVIGLQLDKQTINAGDPLGLTVTLANRGTKPEVVDVNATYTFNGVKTVGQEFGVNMTLSAIRQFTYTMQTSSLVPGTYTVLAQVGFRNPNSTTIQYFTPTFPQHSVARQPFIVQGQGSGTQVLSLPLIAGSAVAAIAIVSLLVFVVRRRRKEEP
jgi:hypothetical protein